MKDNKNVMHKIATIAALAAAIAATGSGILQSDAEATMFVASNPLIQDEKSEEVEVSASLVTAKPTPKYSRSNTLTTDENVLSDCYWDGQRYSEGGVVKFDGEKYKCDGQKWVKTI